MKLAAILLAAILILCSVGNAAATLDENIFNEKCINASARTFSMFTDTSPKVLNQTFTENCPYGCMGGECKTGSMIGNSLPIALLCVIIFLGMIYLSVNLSAEHTILGWLFVTTGIAFAVSGLFAVQEVAAWGSAGTMMSGLGFALIMLLVVVIFYFLLTVLVNTMKKMNGALPYGKKRRS